MTMAEMFRGALYRYYEPLEEAYLAPGRAYHNLAHIKGMLEAFFRCPRLSRENEEAGYYAGLDADPAGCSLPECPCAAYARWAPDRAHSSPMSAHKNKRQVGDLPFYFL